MIQQATASPPKRQIVCQVLKFFVTNPECTVKKYMTDKVFQCMFEASKPADNSDKIKELENDSIRQKQLIEQLQKENQELKQEIKKQTDLRQPSKVNSNGPNPIDVQKDLYIRQLQNQLSTLEYDAWNYVANLNQTWGQRQGLPVPDSTSAGTPAVLHFPSPSPAAPSFMRASFS
eukprot:TRINITY_DN3372_c0_g1_i1.p1 TRINITY_DN3372_c0_g1~~TRINITY_DN3372_c0_g1_i1.p1  ORF type:complete len:175 (-),score=28.06 TRINITY_DN3372_c0_g1_i1:22-546(-)